jgi:hypothetical protein
MTFDRRQAAREIMEQVRHGSLPEPALSAIIGISPPDPNMRYADGSRQAIERMSRLERVFDSLLQDHDTMAVGEEGGLRIVPPAERLETSRGRGMRRVDAALRSMMQEARYYDPKEFSNSEVAELHNFGAWLHTLRAAIVPSARQLKHALFVDSELSKPRQPSASRLPVKHPALEDEEL